jgi:hypothetical protein
MTRYRVTLLSADGSVQDQQMADYLDDDQAIDRVGRLHHPHKMQIHQGGRLVAEFQPLWTSRLA